MTPEKVCKPRLSQRKQQLENKACDKDEILYEYERKKQVDGSPEKKKRSKVFCRHWLL